MSKFTPGPWKHYDAPNQVEGDAILGPLRHHTQSIARVSRNPKEWKANAQVMAVAPELYEALKDLLTFCKEEYGHYYSRKQVLVEKRAKQVLAKVEGGTS